MTVRDPWLDELYESWFHALLKTAIVLLGNRMVAEEMTQDVFLILLSKREEVETYEHPEGWLFKTLRNRINNELRRAKYKHEIPYDPECHYSLETEEDMKLEFVLPPGLKEEERQFLIWYFEDDLGHEEIASRLGCSIRACYKKLDKAKKKCKKLLLEQRKFSNVG